MRKAVFVHSKVMSRHRDEFVEVDASQADYMDISPRMVVSVATATDPLLGKAMTPTAP